jgi:hypothetical protein
MIEIGLTGLLLLVVFLLGDQFGRDSTKRAGYDVQVNNAETEVKNLKTQRATNTTPPWMYFALIGLLTITYIVWCGYRPEHRIERRWDW